MVHFVNLVENKKYVQLLNSLAILIGITGILYLLWKCFSLSSYHDLDFRYLWLSGHLWSENISPYSSEFQKQGPILFGFFNGDPFYYPPNWWPISVLLAQIEFPLAKNVWLWFNTALILLSSIVLKEAFKALNIKLSWTYILFYTGVVSIMQATPIILQLGQTTILIYFAICLIFYATVSKRNTLLLLGFLIVLLKPHIGLAIMVAFCPFKQYHRTLLYSCLITGLFIIPTILIDGVVGTVSSYLNNISIYGKIVHNTPENLTGLRNIAYKFGGLNFNGIILSLAVVFCTFTAIQIIKHNAIKHSLNITTETKFLVIILIISIIGFMIPLHQYDSILMAPVIVLLTQIKTAYRWLLVIPFLVMLRPGNISRTLNFEQLGWDNENGTFLVTVSILSILILTVIEIRKNLRTKTSSH